MSQPKKQDTIRLDRETHKWFDKFPITERAYIETTVVQCDKCGLFYKPSLGHKCLKAVDSNG